MPLFSFFAVAILAAAPAFGVVATNVSTHETQLLRELGETPALSVALALSGAPALRVKFTEQQVHIFNALFLCAPWAATRRPGPSELYSSLVFARAVPTGIT